MLSDRKLKEIAKVFVERSLGVGRKPNPYISKARKKFGKIVDMILKKNVISPSSLSREEIKIMEKLKDPSFGPLIVEYKRKYYVKKTVGHTVRLIYSQADKECVKLAKFIEQECWKRGAHVLETPFTSADSRMHIKLSPFDTLAELPELTKAITKVDYRIFLGGEEDEMWTKGFEDKMKAGSFASQRLREIADREKVRWCYFGWPIKKIRGNIFVPERTYRKIFYQAIEETFNPRLQKICSDYYKALKNVEQIRIVADDGTDLEFSVKGRPWLIADGVISKEDIARGDVGLNIPDGEVFIAPIENSANGYILFDWVSIHGFGLVKNLEIKFKNGKVVWYSADEGKEIFKKFLDANTGEKDRIAEFGIGTNVKANFVGETIIDEKIFGTIHIAIGYNRGAYHGKNKASSHQDMIKIMKNGYVYADGKLVMKKGLPAKK